MKTILSTAEAFCVQNGLLEKGDRILVAFSGGPDSTALLIILDKLSRKVGFGLRACYINHNIRPKAARREITFCSNICVRLKIPLIVVEADIPRFSKEKKLSLEEAGREFRCLAFARVAAEEKCNKIALGHHRDDIVETILFRLFRGTGPQGIWPIKPVSGNVIRPLCEISRWEIEKYLRKFKVGYMTDMSNLNENFSRNFIRNRIIPEIEKGFGTKFRSGLINFAKILSEEDKHLSRIALNKFRRISLKTPGGKIIIDLGELADYDLWLRRRIIRLSLQVLIGQPGAGSFEEVGRIDRIIEGKLTAVNLHGKVRAIKEKNSLFLIGKKCRLEEKKLPIGEKILLSGIDSSLECRLIPRSKAHIGLLKRGFKVAMDYSRVEPPLYVRGIRPGDKFTPLGMEGTKKVGDFFTDRKISRNIRDEIPLVLDRQGIIWLAGYQIAERTRVDKNTKNVLEIELLRGKRNGKAEI